MESKPITVKVPDTIPDPEFSILARCKGTLDEWEIVEYEEQGMCKWKMLSDKFPEVGKPECKPNESGLVQYHLYSDGKFCQFCGRKIERL